MSTTHLLPGRVLTNNCVPCIKNIHFGTSTQIALENILEHCAAWGILLNSKRVRLFGVGEALITLLPFQKENQEAYSLSGPEHKSFFFLIRLGIWNFHSTCLNVSQDGWSDKHRIGIKGGIVVCCFYSLD